MGVRVRAYKRMRVRACERVPVPLRACERECVQPCACASVQASACQFAFTGCMAHLVTKAGKRPHCCRQRRLWGTIPYPL
eukprot:2647055-Pleurochrysis_carterae.AAC.1